MCLQSGTTAINITVRHIRLLTAHSKAGHHVRKSITHDTMLERLYP